MRDQASSTFGPAFLTSFESVSYTAPYIAPSHWLNGRWQNAAKRTMDIVFAALLLTVFITAMLMIALAIRLETPGPALFRQRRIGLANSDFEMWKFRTMHQHVSTQGRLVQSTRRDPRITHVGAFLRRTSLDELPQLFNVLIGDMRS